MEQRLSSASRSSTWFIITSAAAVLTITMGVRQTFGLFVLPLHTSIGLGIALISFAMAVGQLFWGATQPFFGVLADKWGSYRVIVLGGILLAAGLALTPVATLLTIPIAWPLREGSTSARSGTISSNGGVWRQTVLALKDRSYLCLHAGFFTCGFHVAFLITHLPGEVALSGHSASVSAASIGIIGLLTLRAA